MHAQTTIDTACLQITGQDTQGKMTESVEEEDMKNMIVLVVDEECSKDNPIKTIVPITIKVEPLDESTEDLPMSEIYQSLAHTEENENSKPDNYPLEIDTKDPESFAELLEDDTIKVENEKQEEEYEIEYLEDFSEEDMDFPSENHDNSQDYSDEDKIGLQKKIGKKKKKQRTKTPQFNKTPKKRTQNIVSYVDELRKKHPILAKDEQALVEHLARVMRETRPPKPPKGYCKIIMSDGQTKYECTLCGAERFTGPLAARHFQFKHGEFYLQCFACGVKYRNTTNLYKHEKRCRAPDAQVVLQARGRYLGRKGRGRPFTTTHRFSTTGTQDQDRLYCSQCGASFKQRYMLTAHENSHQGRRPFRCERCSMAYTSHVALTRHMKLHGEYRYICDHCGRKFQLKPALVSHLDSHRPLRKHPCQYCERRFSQKVALNHHVNKVHLNLPAAHGCPVCPKRYARLTHVKEHAERVHGLTLITRRMYVQALPAMTEKEVSLTKKYFNINSKGTIKDTEELTHILPDLNNEKQCKNEIDDVKYKVEQNNTETHSIQLLSKTPIKTINKEDHIRYKIERKGKQKRALVKPDTIKAYNEMQLKAREMKSKSDFGKGIVPMENNLHKKRNFIKHEIKKDESVILQPNTVMKMQRKNARKSTKINVLENTEVDNDSNDDEARIKQESQKHEEVGEKNKLIADFMQYLKSGIVPKRVPLLHKGGRTKDITYNFI